MEATVAFEWMGNSCLLVSDLKAADCAAWAQAWATLVGLGVAVWVGSKPARDAARHAKQTRLERLEFAAELVRESTSAVTRMMASLDRMSDVQLYRTSINALESRVRTLVQALSHPLPVEATRAILRVMQATVSLAEHLELADKEQVSQASRREIFKSVRERAEKAASALADEIEVARRDAG
jgi:hypothetical protein